MADKLAEECFTSDPGGTEEALGTDAGVGIGEQTPRSEPIEIVTVLKPARAYDQAPARASATDDMVAGNVYQQSPWGERYVQPISGGKQAQETVIEASETTIEGRDSSENGENGETRERTGSLLLSQVVARMSDTDSTDYGLDIDVDAAMKEAKREGMSAKCMWELQTELEDASFEIHEKRRSASINNSPVKSTADDIALPSASSAGTVTSHLGKNLAISPSRIKPMRRRSSFDRVMLDFLSKNEGPGQRLATDGGSLLLAAMLYLGLYFALGDYMLPTKGSGGAVFLLWVSSSLLGALAVKATFPALLGNLVAGIVLRNVPGDLLFGLTSEWSSNIRALGLCVILMRSGLELDINQIRRAGIVAIRLTVLPGCLEAFGVSGIGVAIFGMPWTTAIALGFILAAVSPAIVTVGFITLKRAGYGVAKGIPTLVISAACFDDVVAISGYSIAAGIAFSSSSLVMSILHGPIEIIAGVAVGCVAGVILSMCVLWDSKARCSVAVLFMGLAMMYAFKKAHYSSAGALGSLVMCIVATRLWQQPRSGMVWTFLHGKLVEEDGMTLNSDAEHFLNQVWDIVAQPCLFAAIGASLDFSTLEGSTIPKAIAVICGGLAVRIPIAYLSTYGQGMTLKEHAFVALSWMPKATVQAALGSVPLEEIMRSKADEPNFKEWQQWGNDIVTTAVMSILVTAPIGLLVINKMGPLMLSKTDPYESDTETPTPSLRSRHQSDESGNVTSTTTSLHSSAHEVTPTVEPADQGYRPRVDTEHELEWAHKNSFQNAHP